MFLTVIYNQAGLAGTSGDGAEEAAFTYDALGRTLSSTQTDVANGTAVADVRTITTGYDDANRKQSTLDADGNETRVTLDGLGRVVGKQLYSGGVLQPGSGSYTLDASGNVTSQTDLCQPLPSLAEARLRRLPRVTSFDKIPCAGAVCLRHA